ncbi:MAG TPA: hypothetical protein PLU81_05720 [Deltaproteobacteria bacterium]|nr:hypothetical protein [Deltaproteobacteria bacterium]
MTSKQKSENETQIKKTFRLWAEYLKRSSNYQLAVRWFDEQVQNNLYLNRMFASNKLTMQQVYRVSKQLLPKLDRLSDREVVEQTVFIMKVGEWFKNLSTIERDGITIDLRTLFATYEMFRNVNNPENTFDQIWERLQRDELIQLANKVHYLKEDWVLTSIFNDLGGIIHDELRKTLKQDSRPDPQAILDIVKKGFKEFLERQEPLITITHIPVFHRTEKPGAKYAVKVFPDVKENFAQKVREHTERLYHSAGFEGQSRYLYLTPTTYREHSSLQKYLEIYDTVCMYFANENNPIWEKVANIYSIHNSKDKKGNVKYIAGSDAKNMYIKAQKIINNVEHGIFPGSY